MDVETLNLLQRRIASTSIGPSTARGMGPKGTIEAARSYLASLNLSKFTVESEPQFRQVLNRVTRAYVKNLPEGGQHWGPARKFLNIFLRGVVYNRYLCQEYDLYQIEPWLEVPLDSHVANGLRLEKDGDDLPRWTTVKWLQPAISSVYQEFANNIASEKGISRVHLDLFYWRR